MDSMCLRMTLALTETPKILIINTCWACPSFLLCYLESECWQTTLLQAMIFLRALRNDGLKKIYPLPRQNAWR